MELPTLGWALRHQLTIKTTPYRYVHMPLLFGQFLSWDFFHRWLQGLWNWYLKQTISALKNIIGVSENKKEKPKCYQSTFKSLCYSLSSKSSCFVFLLPCALTTVYFLPLNVCIKWFLTVILIFITLVHNNGVNFYFYILPSVYILWWTVSVFFATFSYWMS